MLYQYHNQIEKIPDTPKPGFRPGLFVSPPPRIKTGRQKILLVEDNPSNVLIVSTFLEHFGYRHDIACSGMDVLQKVLTNPYALVLMDVNIPEIDGLTITRKLREFEMKHQRPPTPVVAMTAHALAEDRRRCLEAGMDDYISKPFSQAQLRLKVELNICY